MAPSDEDTAKSWKSAAERLSAKVDAIGRKNLNATAASAENDKGPKVGLNAALLDLDARSFLEAYDEETAGKNQKLGLLAALFQVRRAQVHASVVEFV